MLKDNIISIEYSQLETFSDLSGDNNPIHLNEIYARNSMFGEIIVYGVYQILNCLELFLKHTQKNIFIKNISAKFKKKMGINERILIKASCNNKTVKYSIYNKNEALLSTIKFEYTQDSAIKSFKDNKSTKQYTEKIYYDNEILEKLFPNVSIYLSPVNIGILLATTRIIGMNVLKKELLYTSLMLDFNACNQPEESLSYNIDKNTELPIFSFSITNKNVRGKILALELPKLQADENTQGFDVNSMEDKSLKEQRALIIGGTSGLGLECVNLLVNKGANVMFSFFKNKERAEKLTKKFKNNKLKVKYLELDVLNIKKHQIQECIDFAPTHLYYFATPHIIQNRKYLSEEIFQNFCKYYIFSLDYLIRLLPTLKAAFVPSTTAIEELPKDMIEYSLAKYAMELYIEHLKTISNIIVYCPRLPRITTRQTVGILPVELKEAKKVIRDELAEFNKLSLN